MIETSFIVGVRFKDPKVPGVLYLNEDGSLTRNPEKAKLVSMEKIDGAYKEVRQKSSSGQLFYKEVAIV